MDEWRIALMYVVAMVFFILVFTLVIGHYAHGDIELQLQYKEKLCFMTVQKGEMAWCYFGDENEPTVKGNSIEIKNNPHIIDQFLYFLETGISKDNE